MQNDVEQERDADQRQQDLHAHGEQDIPPGLGPYISLHHRQLIGQADQRMFAIHISKVAVIVNIFTRIGQIGPVLISVLHCLLLAV